MHSPMPMCSPTHLHAHSAAAAPSPHVINQASQTECPPRLAQVPMQITDGHQPGCSWQHAGRGLLLLLRGRWWCSGEPGKAKVREAGHPCVPHAREGCCAELRMASLLLGLKGPPPSGRRASTGASAACVRCPPAHRRGCNEGRAVK